MDDARESENREEEKHIARKIESFGGDGFVVVIVIIIIIVNISISIIIITIIVIIFF